jgi:hypothetical protein
MQILYDSGLRLTGELQLRIKNMGVSLDVRLQRPAHNVSRNGLLNPDF